MKIPEFRKTSETKFTFPDFPENGFSGFPVIQKYQNPEHKNYQLPDTNSIRNTKIYPENKLTTGKYSINPENKVFS